MFRMKDFKQFCVGQLNANDFSIVLNLCVELTSTVLNFTLVL